MYAYVGDNPVNAVDPDGRDGIIASAEDIDTLWSASLRSSMVGGVTGKFGPGSGRTLFLERGDPGVHSNGLPLEGKADVTFGREASSEAMVQAYDAAGGGAAGEAAAEAIYSAAANDVSSATITLAPAAGDGVMLHEVGHLDQALREPEKFKEQTAEAAGARTSREYRASASEKYAEKFRREARRKDRREESQ